jgi:hypothetical protein
MNRWQCLLANEDFVGASTMNMGALVTEVAAISILAMTGNKGGLV